MWLAKDHGAASSNNASSAVVHEWHPCDVIRERLFEIASVENGEFRRAFNSSLYQNREGLPGRWESNSRQRARESRVTSKIISSTGTVIAGNVSGEEAYLTAEEGVTNQLCVL